MVKSELANVQMS